MEKFTKFGHEFEYEKLMPEKFKQGPCAFRIKGEDGDEMYLVAIPESISECKREIATPNDGILCAVCPSEGKALMVASSICIAAQVAEEIGDTAKAKCEAIERTAKELGFDIDKLRAEVDRLRKEGKSASEIAKILKPRMEDFKRADKEADAKQEGGEW